MRQLSTTLILLFLALAPAWAQNGLAVSTVQAASAKIISQQADGLAIAWSGKGRVAGDMVDGTFLNESNSPMSVSIVPGIVLSDSDGVAQPIMLEDTLEFTLAPGESTKVDLRAYCLDFSKDPPSLGSGVNYEIVSDLAQYEDAIKNLWAGLRLERDGKFKAVLKPIQHRTIVIQRAIWASLGGQNPATEEKFREDLQQDTQAGDHEFSKEKVDWLAEQIWKDVVQTKAAAPQE